MDLGISKSNFQIISEPDKYVFAILQQKYTFAGVEIADKTGDIWVFALRSTYDYGMIYYKRVPYNYTIQQIGEKAWVQAADDLGTIDSFSPESIVQTSNGRIWIIAGVVISGTTKIYSTFYNGTSWQNWAQVNNAAISNAPNTSLLWDGTNLVISWLQQVDGKIYYKSVSQADSLSTIQSTADTLLTTIAATMNMTLSVLKLNSGSFFMTYQRSTAIPTPYNSSVYYRRASTFAGLATATETEIVNNYLAGGIDFCSVTQNSADSLIIVAYNKDNGITFAYKTSSDDGVTWSSETVVSTNFGENNVLIADLNDELHIATNVLSNGQYTPYLSRVPRITRKVSRGCPLCGSLRWNGLMPDPKHSIGKALHPTPTAGGGLLRNDDPTGEGPTYFHCVQCGWILDVAKTQKGTGRDGNVMGYTV